MHRAIYILLVLFLVGCSEPELNLSPSRLPNELIDCTESLLASWEQKGWGSNMQSAKISETIKKSLIDLSTNWAIANKYLPCEYQMCAVITSEGDDRVMILIRPEEDTKDWIMPAADLLVSLEDLAIINSNPAHTGCAHRANVGT